MKNLFISVAVLLFLFFSGCTREVIVSESILAERRKEITEESFNKVLHDNFCPEFEIVEFLGNNRDSGMANWFVVSFRGNKFLWRKNYNGSAYTEVMVPYTDYGNTKIENQ